MCDLFLQPPFFSPSKMKHFRTTSLHLWGISSIVTICRGVEQEPVDMLFRQSLDEWRSSRGEDWKVWIRFGDVLAGQFQESGNSSKRRLEVAGGFEEGILAIERATIHQGSDSSRDSALSALYFEYGSVLSDLSAEECIELALDPHTLLIGAETASRDHLSTKLCIENSENSLRNAVALDARNEAAEKLLRSITGSQSVHERKPKEFVAELFDSFADTFDEKLKSLEYKVPALVGEAAKRLGPTYKHALDAGCGTGLAGRLLRPLVSGVMVGVDASKKMLDIAATCTIASGCGLEEVTNTSTETRPLYEKLLVMDLDDITLENTLGTVDPGVRGFELVVAADVFVYFGQLNDILRTVARLSTNEAVLIFSCEKATTEEAPLGWRLLSTGRFAHTKEHAVVAGENAGYKLVMYQEIVPRIEKGENVQGHLFGFKLMDQEAVVSSSEEL